MLLLGPARSPSRRHAALRAWRLQLDDGDSVRTVRGVLDEIAREQALARTETTPQ